MLNGIRHALGRVLGRIHGTKRGRRGSRQATGPRQQLAAWRRLSKEEQTRRNCARLDRLVIPYDALVEHPTELGSDAKRPLVFLHVQKAGGTTLEYIIAKNYDVKRLIHINQPALYENPRAIIKRHEPARVIMGHHRLSSGLYQFVDRRFAHITMLRDPVLRVLSYYAYLRSGEKHAKHAVVRDMTLEEFVVSKQFLELENAQTLRLSGMLQRSTAEARVDRFLPGTTPQQDARLLDLAKTNLLTRFSFFGLTERYTEFLLMARKLLGWADIYYERRNVSKKRVKKDEVDPEVIQLIRERNAFDDELHRFAVEVFDERCRKLGISQDDVARFDELNATYHDLMSAQLG